MEQAAATCCSGWKNQQQDNQNATLAPLFPIMIIQ